MTKSQYLNLTDEQLIISIKEGDTNNYSELYRRYFDKVYNRCLGYCKNPDDAFDYAQEILLKAYDHLHSFKGESKFSTWLFAITQNYCLTQIGKKSKVFFEELSESFIAYSDEFDIDEFENKEKKEALVINLMTELTEEDRLFLDLKYRLGCSIEQIKTQFGLSASAVKMRLLRARQKINEMYKMSERICA